MNTPEFLQHARELASECSSEEEFLAAFGLANVCDRCGRAGLDDEEFTDCEPLVHRGGDPEDEDNYDLLVCHNCLSLD